MVFSSLSFLVFFLPCTVLLYYVFPGRRWRNGVLLGASLLFYAWGEPAYLPVMLAAALTAYLGGLGMAFFPRIKKPVFLLTVVLLLGNLFFFKYSRFAAENLGKLLGRAISAPERPLPLGISFYTFQILTYVIDLYRGRISLQKSFFRLLLYVSLFPQLIAGPIVRYAGVENEIVQRRETVEELGKGARRFIRGMAKKVLLANGAAAVAEHIYAGDASLYGTAMLWLAALAYTLQIYYDFSGYSDMAIGLGQLFGFHFPENFDYPYSSLSVTEFWRRWHMSLSGFFRDYVYIPLGGNRVTPRRWVFNLIVVWALTGLWHGAAWNFVFWGLYYGLLLVLEKLVWGRTLQRAPRALRWLYTFLIVTLGWVLFNLSDPAQLREVLFRMFSLCPTDLPAVLADDPDLIKAVLYLPAGLLFSFPWTRRLSRIEGTAGELGRWMLSLTLLLLSVVWIISTKYNPFIYFNF